MHVPLFGTLVIDARRFRSYRWRNTVSLTVSHIPRVKAGNSHALSYVQQTKQRSRLADKSDKLSALNPKRIRNQSRTGDKKCAAKDHYP